MQVCSSRRLSIIGLGLLLAHCADRPTPPAPYKSPRDFKWRFDTLAIGSGQTLMRRLSGYSSHGVYAVGHSSEGGSAAMLKFDGSKWSTTGYHFSEGGPVMKSTTLSDVGACSDGTVWFAGNNAEINPTPPPTFNLPAFLLRFQGGIWTQYNPPGVSFLRCLDVQTSTDAWAGGSNGKIVHFTGQNWIVEQLPIFTSPSYEVTVRDIACSGRTVHAVCTKNNPTTGETVHYFASRDSAGWMIRDSLEWVSPSASPQRWGDLCLWQSPSGHLYSGGDGVFRWDGTKWIRIANQSQVFGIGGVSDSDFLAVGTFGLVLHFDGRSAVQIPGLAISDFHYQDAWYRGSEAIVIGHWGSATIVAYGE
jgi:hypothetical protein